MTAVEAPGLMDIAGTIASAAPTIAAAATTTLEQQFGGVNQRIDGTTVTGNTQIAIAQLVMQGIAGGLGATLHVVDNNGMAAGQLAPGQHYTVQVRTAAAPAGSATMLAGTRIDYRMAFLPIDGNQALGFLAVPQPVALSAENIVEARDQFHLWAQTIQMAPQLPAMRVRLVLYARGTVAFPGGGSQAWGELAVAETMLELDGNVPFDARWLTSATASAFGLVDIHAAPDGVAYIYIQQPAGRMQLLGFCKGVAHRLRSTPPLGADVAFSAVDQLDTFAQAVFYASSQHLGEFWSWLKEAHTAGLMPHTFTLVEIGAGAIPWELFLFEPRKHLGMVCAVARWADIANFGALRTLLVQAEQRSGAVLALLPDAQPLPAALAGCRVERVNTPAALWERLFAAPDAFALVYIAGLDPAGIAALTQTLTDQLFFGASLAPPRPVFFVDLPGSAAEPVGRADSLAANLLPSVADGLIGIATPTLPADFPDLAEAILTRLVNGAGPAEALRAVREHAVLNYKMGQAKIGFIAGFLYLYYGNPLLTLNITRSGAEGGT